MPRATHERVFGAALSNEYQWRNLYLKEFGCCTYAPPIPKDPTTTAEGVYPLRRQLGQLNHNLSDSDSDNFTETDHERGANLSLTTVGAIGKDASFQSASHLNSSGAPSRGTVGDQFFLLDLCGHTPNGQQRGASRRTHIGSGGRRGNRGAALRKDDFFDTNDAFSTKFFGFLWRLDDDDDVEDIGDATDEDEADDEVDQETTLDALGGTSSASRTVTDAASVRSTPSKRSRGRLHPHSSMRESVGHPSSTASYQLSFSRNALSTPTMRSELHDNPHGVHPAVLRLHHETWTMLMDNRLMAWLHQQTADHYQSATQLRQRLLDVVARGPSSIAAAEAGGVEHGDAAPAAAAGGDWEAFGKQRGIASFAPTRTPEEALQSTFESFSPFFVVIAPPAAVQRAKDQFQAARRSQARSGNRTGKTAPADIVGLPLYSQYGSWREAYEHRQRWGKAPFSFFFLHDCSYNYAQVAAVFVQLHLLFVHAHTHTRQCAEAKREAVLLHNAGQQTTARLLNRAVEYQRLLCPLTAMQEVTENIILAYEQSPSRATLTMLRCVLDFLTDAALDVVTAHRFLSRDALLRQSGFDIPGMETRTARAPPATTASSSAEPPTDEKESRAGRAEKDDKGNGTGDHSREQREAGKTDVEQAQQPSLTEDMSTTPTLTPSAIPVAYLEPQRVTERDVNDLFELAYWFVDTATANAGVPIDEALQRHTLAAEPFNFAALGLVGAEGEEVPPLPSSPIPQKSEMAVPQERYLPGKEQLYNPVETFVEAVELLEAHRKPLWMQHAAMARNQAGPQPKKMHAVMFQHDEIPNGAATFTASPMVSADSFTGLATPLVVLTTYLRLHGGQWLRQLCTRVFDTLRQRSVLLYVNTMDMDEIWAHLQPPTGGGGGGGERRASTFSATTATPGRQRSPSTAAPSSPTVRGRGRGSSRMPGKRLSASAATAQSAPGGSSSQIQPSDSVAEAEAARRGYIEGQGRFESMICEDILFALTEFFDALYGKRSTGRLPHGISVLLTQFVTTVQLFLLESAGGAGVGGIGTGDGSAPGSAHGGGKGFSPGAGIAGAGVTFNGNAKKHPANQLGGRAALQTSPARQMEERLQMCKQRYQASMRRRQADSAEAYRAGARGGSGAARQAQQTDAHASASLRRLIQTIDQHRLAKFVLFDCWILPALTNAISLGYLAPDSPLHLRWNIDALARYLKVLVHAPFAEQDKIDFASLASHNKASNASGKYGDGGNGGGGKRKSVSSRPSRQKANKASDTHAQPTNVLTLPPYLTGIYDVATGALVRLQAAPSSTWSPADNSKKSLLQNSLVDRSVKRTGRSGAPSPEMFSMEEDRPSFVLSGRGTAELSELESQSTKLERSKHSLFDLLSAPTASDLASRGPLSCSGSTGRGTRAGQMTTYSTAGAATIPARGSVASTSPMEKSFLPPVALTVDRAADTDVAEDGEEGRQSLPRTRRSVATASAHPAEASRSSVQRGRSRRQRNLSNTFDGKRSFARSPSSSVAAAAAASHASPGTMSITGVVEPFTAQSPRPYVFVSDAGWLDMSPAMHFLNAQLGLTRGDPEGEDADTGDLLFPRMPTTEAQRGRGTAAAAMTTGMRLPSMEDAFLTSSSTQPAAAEDLPAVQAMNAFCKAASSDESDNVVVSEFEVLPSMAAGCIEKLYDIVTGADPMVERAMQTGAFNFTRQGSRVRTHASASGFSSLYSACLNGVLLHPRTASRVMRNVFENSPVFGHALMKPVVSGTALELLSSLVARHGETPMVDANAVVPLLQMIAPNDAPWSIGDCAGPSHNGTVSASGATNTSIAALAAATNAALVHRWESESRRLLRQLAFLTTGFADTRQPLPLVPGLRRPVGPAHPIHMIRAGANRIAADSGAAAVPIVFDPWWRAMVVALSVKAANMFDECRDEHAAAFLKTVHEREDASKLLNRQATAHFITTKGKQTEEKNDENEAKGSASTATRRTRTGTLTSTRRGRDARRPKGSESISPKARKKPASKRSSRPSMAASVTSAAGS